MIDRRHDKSYVISSVHDGQKLTEGMILGTDLKDTGLVCRTAGIHLGAKSGCGDKRKS
jgi:hypothetical protein